MSKKIGLLVGREWSFPPAFSDAVGSRRVGVTVEYPKLATPAADETPHLDLIIDRVSHDVPFYRSYLRTAAMRGTIVLNDPVVLDRTDRFLAAAVARRLGVPAPGVALLPHRDYSAEIVHEESLRNLDYPLDWQKLADSLGTPFLLRDTSWSSAHPDLLCRTAEELISHFDRTGQRLMMVQGMTAGALNLRCLVVGSEALLLEHTELDRKYGLPPGESRTGLYEEITSQSLLLSQELGLDVNCVGWKVDGDRAEAVDLVNPVPELDVYCLAEHLFDQVVGMFVDLALSRVHEPRVEESPGDIGRPGGDSDHALDEAPDLAEGLGSLARGLPRSRLRD